MAESFPALLLLHLQLCRVTELRAHPGASREHREPLFPKQCLDPGGMPRLFALSSLGIFIILGGITAWWATPLFKIGFFTNPHADLCRSNVSLAIPCWFAPEERQGCDVKSSCVLWLCTVPLAVCLSKMDFVLFPCLSGERQRFLRAL